MIVIVVVVVRPGQVRIPAEREKRRPHHWGLAVGEIRRAERRVERIFGRRAVDKHIREGNPPRRGIRRCRRRGREVTRPDVKAAVRVDWTSDSETARRLQLEIVHVKNSKGERLVVLLLEDTPHFRSDITGGVSDRRHLHVNRGKVVKAILSIG